MSDIDRLVVFACKHVENVTLPYRLYQSRILLQNHKLYHERLTEDEYETLFSKLREQSEKELLGSLYCLKKDEEDYLRQESTPSETEIDKRISEKPLLLTKKKAAELVSRMAVNTKQTQPIFDNLFMEEFIDVEHELDNLYARLEKHKTAKSLYTCMQNAAILLARLVGVMSREETIDFAGDRGRCNVLQDHLYDAANSFRAEKNLDPSVYDGKVCREDWEKMVDYERMVDDVEDFTMKTVKSIRRKDYEAVTDQELVSAIRLRLYTLDHCPRRDEYRLLRVHCEKDSKDSTLNFYNEETAEIVLNTYETSKCFSTFTFQVTRDTELLLNELCHRRKNTESIELFGSYSTTDWQEACKKDFEKAINLPFDYRQLRAFYLKNLDKRGHLCSILDRGFVCRKMGNAFTESFAGITEPPVESHSEFENNQLTSIENLPASLRVLRNTEHAEDHTKERLEKSEDVPVEEAVPVVEVQIAENQASEADNKNAVDGNAFTPALNDEANKLKKILKDGKDVAVKKREKRKYTPEEIKELENGLEKFGEDYNRILGWAIETGKSIRYRTVTELRTKAENEYIQRSNKSLPMESFSKVVLRPSVVKKRKVQSSEKQEQVKKIPKLDLGNADDEVDYSIEVSVTDS